jgi:hypothetical protein
VAGDIEEVRAQVTGSPLERVKAALVRIREAVADVNDVEVIEAVLVDARDIEAAVEEAERRETERAYLLEEAIPQLEAGMEAAEARTAEWFEEAHDLSRKLTQERARAAKLEAILKIERERYATLAASGFHAVRAVEKRAAAAERELEAARVLTWTPRARDEYFIRRIETAEQRRDRYWNDRIAEAERIDAEHGFQLPGDSALAVVLHLGLAEGGAREALNAGAPSIPEIADRIVKEHGETLRKLGDE